MNVKAVRRQDPTPVRLKGFVQTQDLDAAMAQGDRGKALGHQQRHPEEIVGFQPGSQLNGDGLPTRTGGLRLLQIDLEIAFAE